MQAPSMEPWDRRPLGFPPGMGVSPQQQIARANLNPKYTFDTFVVGSNSRFSHAAALAVGKMPGQAYNPLFLYGGVGLGKTHLMHAIGHEILRHSPNLSIKYLSCEKFTNDVISSIREDRMDIFRSAIGKLMSCSSTTFSLLKEKSLLRRSSFTHSIRCVKTDDRLCSLPIVLRKHCRVWKSA